MTKPCIHFDIVWDVYGVYPGCRVSDTYLYWAIPLYAEEESYAWINGLLGTNVNYKDVLERRQFTNANVPITDFWSGKYVYRELSMRASELVIRTKEEQEEIWRKRREQTNVESSRI